MTYTKEHDLNNLRLVPSIVKSNGLGEGQTLVRVVLSPSRSTVLCLSLQTRLY